MNVAGSRARRAGAVALTLVLALPVSPAVARPGVEDRVEPADVKPAIVWKRIPFGPKRKHQMAAYSERHYGERTWHLTNPEVIVEHYTAGTSFDSAWNSMAANSLHLGEYPGVCSHFLIDTDGTIYQLVGLGIRCRHAIGMNWTAIGIEHVGTSAGGILRNGPMIQASLRLTVWLMARYGISYGNVIGHAEILESPFHHEAYPSWRCSTHGDWNRAEMRVYRRRLRRGAHRLGVSGGHGPRWIDSGC